MNKATIALFTFKIETGKSIPFDAFFGSAIFVSFKAYPNKTS